jgi:hypothetical protein
MKHLLFFILLLSGAAHAQFQQRVNYTIDVTLHDADHTLDAFEKIEYINNSTDTLQFVWVHLWMNAYKTDKSVFSEQLLMNGRSDFYFSGKEKRGYVNQLAFKVNGQNAQTEDHPQYIDAVKVLLPKPLAPGASMIITTPFHVKLPYNWSRGGHIGQSYQATQWFPKIAMYDSKGWHVLPYVDQGEYFDHFGKYDVQITVPKNYVVAATGELQNAEEQNWLMQKAKETLPATNAKTVDESKTPSSEKETKTLRFMQDNVHDFAWFADKRFVVRYDSLQLTTHKVHVWSFYLPWQNKVWKNSTNFMKQAISDASVDLGEYPYNVVRAVSSPTSSHVSAMEYPTIAQFDPFDDEQGLDETIAHELRHNWFQGILANDERTHAWLDEGLNSFYDNRYTAKYYSLVAQPKKALDKMPADKSALQLANLENEKEGQPISTESEKMTAANYGLMAYYKTSLWLKQVEDFLGTAAFDKAMQFYFAQWKFKHPTPQDFQKALEESSGKNLDALFALLSTTKPLPQKAVTKQTKLTGFFNLKDTKSFNYISIAPSLGVNATDGFMIGALVHNYQLPKNKLQFFVAPMLGTSSGQLVGLARVGRSWQPEKTFSKIEVALSAATFNYRSGKDSLKNDLYAGFTKFVPEVTFWFNKKDPQSTITKWLNFKSFSITEQAFEFNTKVAQPDSGFNYVAKKTSKSRYVNQLTFGLRNDRLLNPYDAQLQLQQAEQFMRLQLTANYFLTYDQKGNGLDVRFFAGKFFYLTSKTLTSQANLSRYQFGMYNSPATGDDYTYNNPIIERSQNDNLSSRQIFVRDGGFKFRNDFYGGGAPGRTDDWMVAVNFATDIPDSYNPLSVLPFRIPIRLFLDLGTYAEAWQKGTTLSKFLYEAGLQLRFKKIFQLNYVFMHSADFDYPKTLNGQEAWQQNLTFSIHLPLQFDLQKAFLK